MADQLYTLSPAPAPGAAPPAPAGYAPPGYAPAPGYAPPAPAGTVPYHVAFNTGVPAPAAPALPPGAVPGGLPGTYYMPQPHGATVPIHVAPGVVATAPGSPATAPAPAPQSDPYSALYVDLARRAGGTATPEQVKTLFDKYGGPAGYLMAAAGTEPAAPAPAAPAPAPMTLQLPENVAQYVRQDPATGFFAPIHPSAQPYADEVNKQVMEAHRKEALLRAGPETYFEKDPRAKEWLTTTIRGAIEADRQEASSRAEAQAFSQQWERHLVQVDQAGNPIELPAPPGQKPQRLLTPLGHAFKKHYTELAQAGLSDPKRLMQLAIRSAAEELQAAGQLPAELQPQPTAYPIAPPVVGGGHYAPAANGFSLPPAGPNGAAPYPPNPYGTAAPYGNVPPRPLAAGNLSPRDALRMSVAHLGPNAPTSEYFKIWRGEGGRSPMSLLR